MIGSGRSSVAEVCDISRANVADGATSEALAALKSLGASGKHSNNQERDLHRWLGGLHGCRLEAFKVPFLLCVPGKEALSEVQVPILLPHEIIDALWQAGPFQFQRSMTGAKDHKSIEAFWEHCATLEEWRDHPCLKRPSITRSRLLPIVLHVDGAEFYSNSEYMVWSMGSVFAEGHVWDIKFPCVCIPHALMHNVKEKVHERVADVLAWSLRAAAAGQWPSRGPFGDELSGFRGELAGTVMSGGWHEISGCWQMHLISWQHLARQCEVKGWKLFRLRPKHHQLDHLAIQVARTKLNPRKVMACFSDESFLGYLKRIGVRCHVSNMMDRLFQRYIMFLSLRWHDAKTL
ncbi:Uncharacterized protein SCF082_LOCUS31390 [Durusdinium trenchii]|uniref:Uncharacterized protein n=1 Tax=Durusdinium trenchii TaxID=1381693 RepID=A0ABP0NA50_9DINO